MKCTTYRTDNIGNAWLDIRSVIGPVLPVGSDAYNRDISEWTSWAIANSYDPISSVVEFGKWLLWKCNFGTTSYGNLPTRKRDHVGISYIPCPYDSNNYDPVRSSLWLGFIPSTTSDHGNHYMKVSNNGASWGFSCTFDGCPFFLDNGYSYFK